MAVMAKEFESSKVKQYQVREFYDHFKTCLPKIAMIVQGVFGTSNEDTFNQGEVVVIVSRTHKTLNPRQQLEGGSEYVEAYFITEEDKVSESICLPLYHPDLLIAEVTGIRGLNKEQWKKYQLDIRSQLTSATNSEDEDDSHQTDETGVYETCSSTIRSRTEDKKKLKFPFRTMKKQFERFKNALTTEQTNMGTTSEDTKMTSDDEKSTTNYPDVKKKEPIHHRRNSPPPIPLKPSRKANSVDSHIAAMAKEFEPSKVKQYQVREFYDHFKTCLPKIAMIAQGDFGTCNEDTFNQGEVIVIVSKIEKGTNTRHQGGYDCVEAHFIADGDSIGERLFLPMDVPELLIAEVTGIKGYNKEMWKAYQHQIKSQFTGVESTGGTEDNSYRTDENVVYETFRTTSSQNPEHPIKEKRHAGIKEGFTTGLKHNFGDSVHSHHDDKHAASCSNDAQKTPSYKSKDHRPPIAPKPSTIPDTIAKPMTKLSDELKEKINKRDYKTSSSDDYENNIPRLTVSPFVKTIAQKKHSLDNDNETIYHNKDILNVEKSKHTEDEQEYENRMFQMHTEKFCETKHVVCEAGNRLTLEQIRKLTVKDVSDYLERLNLHKYVETFIKEQIDGELLLSFDEEILTKDFKLKGHEAIKLRKFAKEGHLPAFRKQSLP